MRPHPAASPSRALETVTRDLSRMTHLRTVLEAVPRAVALGVALGLALAGCQTVSDEGVAVVAGVEPTLPSSNEAYRIGRTNLAAGNSGLAERTFRAAVERNRDDAASWLGLAAAYDNLGRFELADRAYAQAIRLRGETLEIRNNRGYSYLLRGDGARAFEEFDAALALDPGNPVIRNNVELLRLGQRPTRSAPNGVLVGQP